MKAVLIALALGAMKSKSPCKQQSNFEDLLVKANYAVNDGKMVKILDFQIAGKALPECHTVTECGDFFCSRLDEGHQGQFLQFLHGKIIADLLVRANYAGKDGNMVKQTKLLEFQIFIDGKELVPVFQTAHEYGSFSSTLSEVHLGQFLQFLHGKIFEDLLVKAHYAGQDGKMVKLPVLDFDGFRELQTVADVVAKFLSPELPVEQKRQVRQFLHIADLLVRANYAGKDGKMNPLKIEGVDLPECHTVTEFGKKFSGLSDKKQGLIRQFLFGKFIADLLFRANYAGKDGNMVVKLLEFQIDDKLVPVFKTAREYGSFCFNLSEEHQGQFLQFLHGKIFEDLLVKAHYPGKDGNMVEPLDFDGFRQLKPVAEVVAKFLSPELPVEQKRQVRQFLHIADLLFRANYASKNGIMNPLEIEGVDLSECHTVTEFGKKFSGLSDKMQGLIRQFLFGKIVEWGSTQGIACGNPDGGNPFGDIYGETREALKQLCVDDKNCKAFEFNGVQNRGRLCTAPEGSATTGVVTYIRPQEEVHV